MVGSLPGLLLVSVLAMNLVYSMPDRNIFGDNRTEATYGMSNTFFKDLKSLEKRIKSLEQPSWDATRFAKRWLVCTKGPCRCSLETKTVSCWRKNLESIPRKQIIPYDTNTLDLSINAVSSLNKDLFNDLQRLTELDMSYNKLDFLPEPIFQPLGSLQHLKLRNNIIEQLHKNIFTKQGRLENLDLSYNVLKRLDPELLRGTPRLVALNLAENALTSLPEHLFQGLDLLEELYLGANSLQTVPGFALYGLVSLRAIDLAGNGILSLPSGLFRDTVNLETIAASRNYLAYLKPSLFRNLSRLSAIDLTSNLISEIVSDQYPPNLRELHLGHNRIIELPPLHNLFHLERLYLFTNRISELRDGVFSGTPALKTLFLYDNTIHLIGPKVFQPLHALENLQLGGNKLTQVAPNVFSNNTKLAGVKLTKNPWHCDCALVGFTKWLKDNKDKIWGMEPTCLSPGELGGRPIDETTEEELCEGMGDLALGLMVQRIQRHHQYSDGGSST